jgi:hypothetical protein
VILIIGLLAGIGVGIWSGSALGIIWGILIGIVSSLVGPIAELLNWDSVTEAILHKALCVSDVRCLK